MFVFKCYSKSLGKYYKCTSNQMSSAVMEYHMYLSEFGSRRNSNAIVISIYFSLLCRAHQIFLLSFLPSPPFICLRPLPFFLSNLPLFPFFPPLLLCEKREYIQMHLYSSKGSFHVLHHNNHQSCTACPLLL